jgi:hypothetical protein
MLAMWLMGGINERQELRRVSSLASIFFRSVSLCMLSMQETTGESIAVLLMKSILAVGWGVRKSKTVLYPLSISSLTNL